MITTTKIGICIGDNLIRCIHQLWFGTTLHQPSEVKAAAVVALEELEGELREKEEELRQKALVLERREMEVRVEDGVLERGRREQQRH